jgi:hypothetical protein
MYRNQYLVSNKEAVNLLPNFRKDSFGNLNVYLESNLSFHKKSLNHVEVGFIGLFFDPLNPELHGDQLLDQFFQPEMTLNTFFQKLEGLSGRFVAFFRDNDAYCVTGDFKHSKNIYHSTQDELTVITSSLKLYYDLYSKEPEFDTEVKSFFESKLYLSKQQDWHGPRTYDKNFYKLLPNHYLDIFCKEVNRIPFFVKKLSFDEVVENSFKMLRGTFDYLVKYQKVIQPITAGWDSRILLGASLPYKDSIKYYVFRRKDNESTPDILLSQKIAKAFGLNFSVNDVENCNEEFIEAYEQHVSFPNYLSKVMDIQYHYQNHSKIKGLVNVSGICGNLFRFVYGCTNAIVPSKKDIHCLSAYGPYSEFTTKEIDLWYEGARHFAKEKNISLIDLFFIENRLGNWGAIYPYEQDLALEEVDPFGNKALMYPVLLLDAKYRGYYKNQLSIRLLEKFDSKLCEFPFNPHKGPLHMFIIRNFATNLLYKKLKFQKFKVLNLLFNISF